MAMQSEDFAERLFYAIDTDFSGSLYLKRRKNNNLYRILGLARVLEGYGHI